MDQESKLERCFCWQELNKCGEQPEWRMNHLDFGERLFNMFHSSSPSKPDDIYVYILPKRSDCFAGDSVFGKNTMAKPQQAAVPGYSGTSLVS